MFLDYFNLKKRLFGENLIKSSLARRCVVLDRGEEVLGCSPPIPPLWRWLCPMKEVAHAVRGFSHLMSIAIA